MYAVALVQNQSEMAHYGYADARPLIKDLGYQPELYTADNIAELHHALARSLVDGVILASNALNDKTIRGEIQSEGFREVFRRWLANSHGCLCLHQLRLAQTPESARLEFLPPPLDQIRAVVRPPSERKAEGTLAVTPGTEQHITLNYPNEIDPNEVRAQALRFKSLPGLYWHYWNDVNVADWETLIIDPSAGPNPRALLLVARDVSIGRVSISSLTLDWQRQQHVLANVLTYIVEGRHETAILQDKRKTNVAFEYLIGTLASRKFPFKTYSVTEGLKLQAYVNRGVHSTVVVGPSTDLAALPAELAETLSRRVAHGQLKVLTIEPGGQNIWKFSVVGHESYAIRLLNDVELRVQAEMRHGYVDGSFWGTTETLQTLYALPHRKADYGLLVSRALELAEAHDRDGSYDEVFGVSCAFLWMRSKFLGVDSEPARRTATWIRGKISDYEEREQVLAYQTFAELGVLQAEERKALTDLLSSLAVDKLSEIDLIAYLRAALIVKYFGVVPQLVSRLRDKQRSDGVWVDLATSATAIVALLDVLREAGSGLVTLGRLETDIQRMIFNGVIHIQDAYTRALGAGAANSYPWDGKASTTMKCIQAWLRFDELIDLPVYELIDTLSKSHTIAAQLTSGNTALAVLEDLKKENEQLRQGHATASAEVRRVKRTAGWARVLGALLLLCLYLLLTFLVVVILQGGFQGLRGVLKSATIDAWRVHATAITFLLGYGILQSEKWRAFWKWFRQVE